MGECPEGIFEATAHVGPRFSSYFHILFTLRTLQNSYVEALCLWENLCSWKNKNRKKVLGKKRKKKNRPQEERKGTILSRKEKKSFVKVTEGTPRWRPDFEQRSRRQTKICHT